MIIPLSFKLLIKPALEFDEQRQAMADVKFRRNKFLVSMKYNTLELIILIKVAKCELVARSLCVYKNTENDVKMLVVDIWYIYYVYNYPMSIEGRGSVRVFSSSQHNNIF